MGTFTIKAFRAVAVVTQHLIACKVCFSTGNMNENISIARLFSFFSAIIVNVVYSQKFKLRLTTTSTPATQKR